MCPHITGCALCQEIASLFPVQIISSVIITADTITFMLDLKALNIYVMHLKKIKFTCQPYKVDTQLNYLILTCPTT